VRRLVPRLVDDRRRLGKQPAFKEVSWTLPDNGRALSPKNVLLCSTARHAAGHATAPAHPVAPLGAAAPRPPPPPSRTKWTRRVPHPVLIGHAASLPRTSTAAPRSGGHAPHARLHGVVGARVAPRHDHVLGLVRGLLLPLHQEFLPRGSRVNRG
jgi:hypothetical protein